MTFRNTLPIITCALALGCGASVEAPGPAPLVRDAFDGQAEAAAGFGVDPYGIGSSWYEYDPGTHALTPRLEVYVARRDGRLVLFEILSYYDARGESGIFTVRGDSWDGASWSGAQEVVTRVNVKDEMTCLSISPFAEVGCDAPEAALILRSSWRSLPDAGFSVREPALLARAHFSWPDDAQTGLKVLTGVTLDEVARDLDALSESTVLPNAGWDPVASRVGWLHDAPGEAPRPDAHLQITGDMELAHWRVTGLGDDGLSVTLEKRCQSASYADQKPLETPTTSATIGLPEGAYSGALVKLCDPTERGEAPRVVTTLEAAPAGAWPDTKTFDLIVEQLDGRVSIRPAPGSPLVNWTTHSGARDFTPPEPEAMWAAYPTGE
jgi:hypothetical protein